MEQTNRKINEEKRRIVEQLPAGESNRMEQLENLYMQMEGVALEDAFCSGFKLGVRLTAAALSQST